MLVEQSLVRHRVVPGICSFKTTVLHHQGQINRFSLSGSITPWMILRHAMTNPPPIMVRTTAAAVLGLAGQ